MQKKALLIGLLLLRPRLTQKIPSVVYNRCARCNHCNFQVLTIDTFVTFNTLDTLANFDNLDNFSIDSFDHFYNFDNALRSQKILGTQNILGSQKPSCLRVFKKSPDSVNSFDNIYMFGPRPVVIFSCPCSSMPTLDSEKVKVFQHLLFLTKSKSYILLSLKQPFWGKHNTQRQWKKSYKLQMLSSQINAINVTMQLLIQAIWGCI